MHSENDCGAGIYTKNKIIIKDKETTEKRRQMQDIQQEEYERTLVSVKERIFETEGADIKEEMKDQIRQWFLECRDATGKLADYPNEEDGGSASLFRNISPEELEQELAAKKEEKGKKKEKKEKEKKKTKKQADNKGDEDGWTMKKSIIAEKINEDLKEYNYVWKNIDESNNFSQRYDLELIKKEKRIEVDNEIRLQVDEIMRQELKNLKMALEKDKGKKGKKAKNSGKRKKKKGGSGKKKKKRDKDLTIDRSIESLYEELVMEGIIIKPDVIKVNDFVGEYSYLGTTLRQINIEPMPSLSDTRRVATQFGILPLGSEYIHENSPLIKSLLFAGPHKTGKKMLVNIICNETGANLFDLTSETIAGKYPGKEGLKLLMNTVFKVAKELQPSVIWIDNCEKMFKKKIPKADTSDPKRIRKELPKAIKNIKSTDRILVIGTSNCPYDADIKKICAIYQKIILIPRPDYASRHLFWRTFLQNNGAIITDNLDISSLSKISNGFTPGQIENVIKTVLTERRKAKLIKRPLKSLEFINNLAKHEPVFKEEEEAFKVWYSKTPLGKKRTKASQNPDDVKVKKKKK
ncbi:IQ and AAA domain-containing protein 1 [Intoshia linei]|uniref:IQ and AAA domain-containing protein 1 n=1 Tax=Intoshia linei TaxID=1819745 RepID=A0A177B013_9BILA|nr:IQ and AAA domain-containing protein 1 [Intoshia linei]